MADNVQVAIKIRPLIKREKSENLTNLWSIRDNLIHPTDNPEQQYFFDHIFGSDVLNSEIFNKIAKPIVESAVNGINGTLFAYGQTASGKTYTMMGTQNEPGVINLSILHIFNRIENIMGRKFLLRVSYLEIYNEKLRDLLTNDSKDIKIREDVNGIVIRCLEEVTNSPEHMLEIMNKGNKNRRIGETNMNERSSRSHTIFKIIIESRDLDENSEDQSVHVSHLNLVDLAGSERVNQTYASGLRLKEGCHINKSLLALSLVIKQLSEGPDSRTFINYRDSKLTRLLQNSLGGNAMTGIICTITPVALDETHSTLHFASAAKKIKTKPKINEVLSESTMLKRMELQITKLENELKKEKTNASAKDYTNQNLRENIKRLVETILLSGSSANSSSIKNVCRKSRRLTWCLGSKINCGSPYSITLDNNSNDFMHFQDLEMDLLTEAQSTEPLTPNDFKNEYYSKCFTAPDILEHGSRNSLESCFQAGLRSNEITSPVKMCKKRKIEKILKHNIATKCEEYEESETVTLVETLKEELEQAKQFKDKYEELQKSVIENNDIITELRLENNTLKVDLESFKSHKQELLNLIETQKAKINELEGINSQIQLELQNLTTEKNTLVDQLQNIMLKVEQPEKLIKEQTNIIHAGVSENDILTISNLNNENIFLKHQFQDYKNVMYSVQNFIPIFKRLLTELYSKLEFTNINTYEKNKINCSLESTFDSKFLLADHNSIDSILNNTLIQNSLDHSFRVPIIPEDLHICSTPMHNSIHHNSMCNSVITPVSNENFATSTSIKINTSSAKNIGDDNALTNEVLKHELDRRLNQKVEYEQKLQIAINESNSLCSKNSEKIELIEHLQITNKNLLKMKVEYDQQLQALVNERNTYQNQNCENLELIKQLQISNEKLLNQQLEYEQKLQASIKESNSCRNQNSEKLKLIKELQITNEKLLNQIGEYEQKIKALIIESDAYRNQNNEHLALIKELQITNEKILNENVILEKNIQDYIQIQQSIEEKQMKFNALVKEHKLCKNQNNEICKLSKELQSANEQILKQQNEYDNKIKEYFQLEQSFKELQDKYIILLNENKSHKHNSNEILPLPIELKKIKEEEQQQLQQGRDALIYDLQIENITLNSKRKNLEDNTNLKNIKTKNENTDEDAITKLKLANYELKTLHKKIFYLTRELKRANETKYDIEIYEKEKKKLNILIHDISKKLENAKVEKENISKELNEQIEKTQSFLKKNELKIQKLINCKPCRSRIIPLIGKGTQNYYIDFEEKLSILIDQIEKDRIRLTAIDKLTSA